MQHISLPLWLLLVLVGLPTLFGLVLTFRLIQKKRKGAFHGKNQSDRTDLAFLSNHFSSHIHHQLLAQQIDAVFNALVAVIETERVKLKALAAHPLPPQPESPLASREAKQGKPVVPAGPLKEENHATAENSIGQRISSFVDQGLAPEEIARRLKMSQSEVALAIQFQKMGNGKKIKAVA
jgi:hypothetical protein